MKTLTILIGIPGSGKSTYIDEMLPDNQIISMDDIKESIGMEFFIPWPSNGAYNNVSAIDAVAKTMCKALMKREKQIVIDDLNIDEHRLTEWLDIADEYNYKTKAIVIDKHFVVCLSRRRDIPKSIMKEMEMQYNSLLKNKSLLDRFDDLEMRG